MKSTVTAWKPPTYAWAPDCWVAAGMTSLRRWCNRSVVAASCGAVLGYTWTGATVASFATGRRRREGHAGVGVQRIDEGVDRCLVAGAGQLDREVERPVDAGPEALGGEVVGDPRRAALRRAAVVGEAQPHRQHRDRDDEHHDERD